MRGGDVLEEKATGPCGEGVVDVAVEVEGGQHDHPAVREVLKDPPGGLQAIDVRHPDIHEHHVGPEPARFGQGLGSVGGLADHGDAAGGEDHAEPGADQVLIVGDENPGHWRGVPGRVWCGGHCGSSGIRARTR
jgi:hypothetical protein